MAFHIFYDYKCPQCGKVYFPVKDKQICGSCGAEIKNNRSVVEEIANGMMIYKKFNGKYTPVIFGPCSVSDNFLLVVYNLFDKFEESKEKDFQKFIDTYYKTIQFGENVYIKKNLLDLILALEKQLYKK